MITVCSRINLDTKRGGESPPLFEVLYFKVR